eukprot:38890_1
MLTTSQSFYKIVNHLIVVQHTKTFHLNCLSQLNNNESADKTAPINKLHYNQPIRTLKSTHKIKINSIQSCIVICTQEERIKCTNYIIINSWILNSNQSVDPPPGQQKQPTTHSKCKNRVGSVTCIVIISSTKHIIVKITIVDELQSVKIVLIELIVKYAVDSITFGINAILISKTNVDNNVISVPDYGLNFIVISTGTHIATITTSSSLTIASSTTSSLQVYLNVNIDDTISITRNDNSKNWYSIKIIDDKPYGQIIHHMKKTFSVVEFIVTNSAAIVIIVSDVLFYVPEVGLCLQPIGKQGASSTLGDQKIVERPLNYLIYLKYN